MSLNSCAVDNKKLTARRRKAPKNKMISIETLVIASVVVTLGWFTGKMITSFVDFVVEYNRKHDRENRDD